MEALSSSPFYCTYSLDNITSTVTATERHTIGLLNVSGVSIFKISAISGVSLYIAFSLQDPQITKTIPKRAFFHEPESSFIVLGAWFLLIFIAHSFFSFHGKKPKNQVSWFQRRDLAPTL